MSPKQFTPHGYPLDEAISAVQKCIRRGDEENAWQWTLEVESRYYRYIWYRLEVIASEDVGPADPTIPILVATLRDQYFRMRDKKGQPSELLPLCHAVLALARAPKTRVVDDLLCHGIDRWQRAGHRELDLPDVALDKHTTRGRDMGRGWDHFNDEGTRLAGEVEGLNPYKELASRARQNGFRIERPYGEKRGDDPSQHGLFGEEDG